MRFNGFSTMRARLSLVLSAAMVAAAVAAVPYVTGHASVPFAHASCAYQYYTKSGGYTTYWGATFNQKFVYYTDINCVRHAYSWQDQQVSGYIYGVGGFQPITDRIAGNPFYDGIQPGCRGLAHYPNWSGPFYYQHNGLPGGTMYAVMGYTQANCGSGATQIYVAF